MEELESRVVPAVALNYGGPGTVLSLTELVNGAAASVAIADSGTNTLTIQLGSGRFDPSSTASAGGLTYANGSPSASSSATINLGTANNIATLLTQLPGDQLILGNLGDSAGGLGNINAAAGSITVMTGDTVNTSAATGANGNIALQADTFVNVSSQATLETGGGSITLLANQEAVPSPGNFTGIRISGTVQTAGVGNIRLEGSGGNDSTSGGHCGVAIIGASALVSATGAGAVTIIGTGGIGSSGNNGVQVDTATVNAVTGSITISGTAGGSSGSTSNFNEGVVIDDGAAVTAASAANITIQGTGAGGGFSNYGVGIGTNGAGATVSSAGGNISITGTGGDGTGSQNYGVQVRTASSTASTTVSTTGAGSLTITGIGGTGTGVQYGLQVLGTTAALSTASGAILLNGTGGSGTGTNNFGVAVVTGATVTSTSGAITINGIGGSGSPTVSEAGPSDDGFAIETLGITHPAITTSGNISIDGTATDGKSLAIQTSGNAANVPTIAATGSGSVLLDAAQDAWLNDAVISTVNGPLTILANQGPVPASGNFYGVWDNQSTIATTGTGNLLIEGTGGNDPTTNNHFGVEIGPLTPITASGSGGITIIGTGGTGSGSTNGSGTGGDVGVVIVVADSMTITTTTGAIRIDGTGAADGSGTGNCGVQLDGVSVTSTSGPIDVTGTGGSGTPGTGDTGNDGILVQDNRGLSTAGTIALCGSVTDGGSNSIELDRNNITTTGSMTVTASAISVDGGTSLSVGGQLLVQPPSSAASMALNNDGSVSVAGNVVGAANTAITNEGSGSFTVAGGFQLGEFSSFSTLAGSTFSVAGAFVLGPDSTFTDDGTLSVSGIFDPGAGYPGTNDTIGGTFNAQAGSSMTTDAATLAIQSSGHLDVAAGAAVTVPVTGTLLADGGGLVTIEGTATVAGMLDGAAGSAVVVRGQGSLVTRSYGQLDMQGTYLVWNNPSSIGVGTALGSAQLDATAMTMVNGAWVSVPGTFTYTPPTGTVLQLGTAQPLSVTFTPNDAVHYAIAAAVLLNVLPMPTIHFNPVNIIFGTALDNIQLSGTVTENGKSIPGRFAYTNAAGTVLNAGNGQSEAVTFTPADTVAIPVVTTTVTVNVAQATPVITWANPPAMPYDTPLTVTQLDAATTIPGTFSYSPPAGTVLPAGTDTVTTTFTPADTTDYRTVTQTAQVVVMGPGVSVVGTELWIVGRTTGNNDRIQISPAGTSTTGSTGISVTGELNGLRIANRYSQSFSTIRVYFYAANSLSNVHVASSLTVAVERVHINLAPVITAAASATPNPVTGTQVGLQVAATDPQNGALHYSWAVTAAPASAAAPVIHNATTGKPTVTFFQAGSYTFTVTVTDASGLSSSSSVTVHVVQTFARITLTPGKVTLADGATQQFAAVALDQFGDALAVQPIFAWQASGGTITASGLYTAPAAGKGTVAVKASANRTSSAAVVTITGA